MPRYNQADTHVEKYTWSNKPTAPEFGEGQAWFTDLNTMGHSNGFSWSIPMEAHAEKAYICMGGDHPDIQYSINGDATKGLHRIPLDRGLPWYLAVNTHTGDVIPGRNGITITWDQIKSLQDQGVDIVSHGVGPHNNSWRRTSTGGYIRYTGDASTASLDISGTFPAISMVTTLAGDQTDGSLGFNISLTDAAYDTIAEVAAYINTLTGWEFYVDPCLAGTELSTNFLIQAATNLKPTSTSITYDNGYAVVTLADHGAKSGDYITVTGVTPSNYNVTNFQIGAIVSKDVFKYPVSGSPGTATVQGKLSFRRPISAGAGLILSYTGTAYQNVRVEVSATIFRIYCDGVALIQYTITNASYNTLAKVSAAVNAAGISGLVCELSDDRRTAPNEAGTASVPYMHGGENSTNLETCKSRDLTSGFVRINAGLPIHYINNRRVDASVEEAATHNVVFKHFASSGLQCCRAFAPTTDRVSEVRGNPVDISTFPLAVPVSSLPAGFHHRVSVNSGYGVTADAHMTCLVDALADSPGHIIDILNHSVSVDGSSGYSLTPSVTTIDLSESQFVELCNKLAANTNKVAAISYSELVKLRTIAQKPKNYLFNPKFKNSGESLLGSTGSTSTQAKLPGIALTTPAHVTAASITDGRLSITTNAATSFSPLQWEAVLEPNTPYELSCHVEFSAYTSGNMYWEIYSSANTIDRIFGGPLSSMTSDQQIKNGLVRMTFELNPPTFVPARIKSKAGPYNVPTGTIKIKYGVFAYLSINLAGATPSATTAAEVCAAFNNAMATAITAGSYTEEWRNWATLENGRVVISAPYRERVRNSETLLMSTDTGSDQITPVFGATLATGNGNYDSSSSAERFPTKIRFKVACQGAFTISDPILREIKNF